MLAPGRFITLEGGEGVGKSTQARRLVAALAGRGISAIATREPGGSPRAEAIRELILSGRAKPFGAFAEAMLFAAARRDHVEETIRPALARGQWVVCDRFADSTRVYQGLVGEVPETELLALERLAVGETRPDLTIVLDLPAEIGLARAAERAKGAAPDRFEAETVETHARIREGFLAIARRDPERCVVVDASLGPDAVAEAIWRAVSERVLERPRPAPNIVGFPSGA